MTRKEILQRNLTEEEFERVMEEVEWKDIQDRLEYDQNFFQWRTVGNCLAGTFLVTPSLNGANYWIAVQAKYMEVEL